MVGIKMTPFKQHGKEGAKEMETRADLMIILRSMIDEHGWDQKQASKKLGTTQARISRLKNGIINEFSLDMLIKFLFKLGFTLKPTYNRKVLKIKVTKAA